MVLDEANKEDFIPVDMISEQIRIHYKNASPKSETVKLQPLTRMTTNSTRLLKHGAFYTIMKIE